MIGQTISHYRILERLGGGPLLQATTVYTTDNARVS
jgi:hypothetical protein